MPGCAVFTPARPVTKPSHPSFYLSQLTKKVSQLTFKVGVPTPIGKLGYLRGWVSSPLGVGVPTPMGGEGYPLSQAHLPFRWES